MEKHNLQGYFVVLRSFDWVREGKLAKNIKHVGVFTTLYVLLEGHWMDSFWFIVINYDDTCFFLKAAFAVNDVLLCFWRCTRVKTKMATELLCWFSSGGLFHCHVSSWHFTKFKLAGGFKYFLCSPLLWGRFPILTNIFPDGLVQPPTSY